MLLFWAQTFPLLCSDFIDPPWKLKLAPCKQIPVMHFSVYIHRDLQIHISNVVVKEESESDITQSCRTLCGPMDCSPPHSSVHGIFQARVLEWVIISFSRRSSWPRDWTRVSHTAGRRFTVWATREAQCCGSPCNLIPSPQMFSKSLSIIPVNPMIQLLTHAASFC